MSSRKFLRAVIILVILLLNIGCDQVSKTIVRHKMEYYDHIGFMHNHFNLIRIENSGAFLSLGDSLTGPLRFIVLSLLPLLALGFGLAYIIVKTNIQRLTLLGVIMVIGGGIGNLYDRLVHGAVTDFMHIKFGSLQTGIFNVADVSIMVGMALILIQTYTSRPKPEKGGEVAPEAEVN